MAMLKAENAAELAQQLETEPIRDVIDTVERTSAAKAAVLFRLLSKERAATVFDALDPRHQAELIGAFQDSEVLEFFEELEPDDRVSLIDELPAPIAERLMRSLDAEGKRVTTLILGYPRGSVGRLMSPKTLLIRDTLTVAEVSELVRSTSKDAETIYTLPIVDADRRVVGVVSLRKLFLADPAANISSIMKKPVMAHVMDDAEDTARWFVQLDLVAIPVVDESDMLVGMLTFDDAHDIVAEAEAEDAARGGGAEPLLRPYLSTPVRKLVRSRIVWLLVLALSAILTVQVLEVFEATLEKAVVLALFIPLLTGTGGNTGNQAATTVTRALALGDVRKSDVFRVLGRELRVGLLLGMLLGSLGFILGAFVYGWSVGGVIGLTLLAICTMAASVGGVMPIIAKAVGADPAVFSNPFISTFCDATGLIIYFLIAKAILGI
ncbi:magnesium transporter [Corynebacterium pacaense]|uniref:magnesium transporter n=1 Tax=Corynebacterium pacaense TaxID=1816684 RepID=UPI0009BB6145|nr:magnesium transporter [Corynebacterium pacaense]